MKHLMAIIMIVVTPIATRVKQSVTLVVNIIKIVMICLVAADHPVIVINSLIQGKVMAMMGAVGRKEIMTFVLLLHIFMVGMSLVIMVTHVGNLININLVVVVNL